jgi:cell division protein FtsI/penicillin-binding protein 2
MPKGFKHSAKAIEKIRIANTLQWKQPSIRNKRCKNISLALKGKPKSDEHKQHLKENHVGRRGKSHSPEQRHRISQSLLGHPGYMMKVKKVRHHIYLRQNSDEIIFLTPAKHNSLHKRAYDYIYDTQGQMGINKYLQWFDKKFGLSD